MEKRETYLTQWRARFDAAFKQGQREALAAACEVNPATISNWGKVIRTPGRAPSLGLPDVWQQAQLAEVLGFSPAYLAFGRGPIRRTELLEYARQMEEQPDLAELFPLLLAMPAKARAPLLRDFDIQIEHPAGTAWSARLKRVHSESFSQARAEYFQEWLRRYRDMPYWSRRGQDVTYNATKAADADVNLQGQEWAGAHHSDLPDLYELLRIARQREESPAYLAWGLGPRRATDAQKLLDLAAAIERLPDARRAQVETLILEAPPARDASAPTAPLARESAAEPAALPGASPVPCAMRRWATAKASEPPATYAEKPALRTDVTPRRKSLRALLPAWAREADGAGRAVPHWRTPPPAPRANLSPAPIRSGSVKSVRATW